MESGIRVQSATFLNGGIESFRLQPGVELLYALFTYREMIGHDRCPQLFPQCLASA